MQERNCNAYPGFCQINSEDPRNGCFLLKLIIAQSKNGGIHDINAKHPEATAGPFWEEKVWNNFCERCVKQALKGCPFKEELKVTIDEITKQKKGRGELFTR